MPPKRCLQLCIAYPPDIEGGGSAMTAHNLTQRLIEAGCKVTVVAPKINYNYYTRSIYRTETTIKPNCRILHVGTWIRRGWKTVNPWAIIKVPFEVAKAEVVIIHGLRSFLGTIGAITCLMCGKTYVVFPHGMTVRRWRSLTLKSVYDRILGGAILCGAKYVACMGRAEQAEVELLLPVRKSARIIQTAPKRPTYERTCLRKQTIDSRCTVLALGRIVPEKGIELLISALADEQLKVKFELILAGPAEEPSYLKRLQALASSASVRLQHRGTLAGAEKDDAIRQTHLLALMSEYESWGNVAVEALELGTPVLLTEACGISREIYPGDGLVVRRSVVHIRKALHELSEDNFRRLRELFQTCGVQPLARGEDLLNLLAIGTAE